jgi:RNA polymerase sigma factor (sigma-70 family)
MSSNPCDTPSPPRHSDDLELAEAALEGDGESAREVGDLVKDPGFKRWLVSRGASPSEADDLLGDLLTDCFGGEKARGGLHRILGKFNGACTLKSFLHRIALNRLISLKRKQKLTVSLERDSDDDQPDDRTLGVDDLPDGGEPVSEEEVVDLLRSAVVKALASVNQERLVLLRLIHSYRIPQNRVGQMWGWHDSKVSRNMATLIDELKGAILLAVREEDPWLQIEWDDFLGLCGESIDLFDY